MPTTTDPDDPSNDRDRNERASPTDIPWPAPLVTPKQAEQPTQARQPRQARHPSQGQIFGGILFAKDLPAWLWASRQPPMTKAMQERMDRFEDHRRTLR